jgi:trans-aconitate 2-methyltransferase
MSEPARRDAWNPEQYTRFRNERSQPFFDLLGLVQPVERPRLVDLGCGTGELTAEAHWQLGARETLGVDNSPAMLEKATAVTAEGLRFEQADIAAFAIRPESAGAFDVVISNAALQWMPEQVDLLGHLTGLLTPDGQLGIQVPSNEDHPSHVVAREVASEPRFSEALGGHVRRFSNLTPEGYAARLDALGYRQQHVRLQVYVHHLPSREDVVEWVRGSLLTDYQRRLSPELFGAFVERYRDLLMPRLEDARPFFYPFKRILVWGHR